MDNTQLGKNGDFERGCLLMGDEYVGWEEVWVCGDKGRREVNYYLRRKDGSTDLVVIGKEKSLRHISYRYVLPVRDKDSRVYVKLKSRREVVNWLRTIAPVSRRSTHRPFRPIEEHVRSKDFHNREVGISKGNKMSEVIQSMPSFMWVGLPWICRKKRMHYPSFLRNGVHIYVHDFVYVLAEENKRLVAYLEDMYEDSRGNKMVVVRWFHKIDEVDIVLPRIYDDREIFFSLCLQELSIECVDGLATVLSPQHYKKFLIEARHTQLQPFVCYMMYEDDDVKPFDLTEVKGYWKQDILRYLSSTIPSKRVRYDDGSKGGETYRDAAVPRSKKMIQRPDEVDEHLLPLKIKFGDLGFQNRDNNLVPCEGITKIGNRSNGRVASSLHQKDAAIPNPVWHLTVGSRVEVLSQDSGIRGCWYRALIVKKHDDKVKVRYEDIQDAVDESKNLEEWLLASKLAVLDKYGIRCNGRSIIRPISSCSQNKVPTNVNVGSIVDVWWHDGWWEGIVVKKDSGNMLSVYFPEENQEIAFGYGDLRISQEWLNNGWNKLNERPDIVSSLSLPELKRSTITSPSTKLDVVSTSDDKDCVFSGFRAVKSEKNDLGCVRRPRVVIKTKADAARDLVKDDLLAQLSWKSSGKRCCRRTVHKLNYGAKSKNNGAVDTRVQTSERFKISSSSRHDPDYCKSVPTSTPLFSSSAVSNFTSLVMSS